MRDGWVKTPIENVAQVLSGFAFKSEFFNKSEGMPLIRIRDLPKRNQTEALYSGNYEDRYVVRKGDFLIGMDGEFHCYEWNGPDALLNQRVCRIQDFKHNLVEPRFIYFSVNQYLEKIEQDTGFTTVKHISSKQILGIEISLPPLLEQKRIVDLISSVDSYIEALQQQLESAKRSRNAVLHELLTAGGDDWVEKSLGDVVSIVNGGTPSTKNEYFWGGSVVWITTTELTAFDGKRVNTSKRTITADGLSHGPARLVRAGTTLVGTTATIGTCAIADCELAFNQQISGLIPLDKNLDDNYLFYWIQHCKPILEGLAAGTSFKRISISVLKTVSIQLPPIGVQQKIAELILQMDDFIESIQHTSIEANNLRSGLLSDLLSGEHEIPASYDKVMDVD
jgi:type I restriction enzyme S subunit